MEKFCHNLMLLDEVEIILRAGHGGPGKVSFFRPPQKGPDGGNGGKGGDVYIKVTTDLTSLNQFSGKKLIEAQGGDTGGSNKKSGKNGKDVNVYLPLGSEVIDQDSGEVFKLENINEQMLIGKGGLGGRGNFELRSSRNTTPRHAQPGLPGEERKLKIILKFLADFGLIGLPNSGKSSLLNELTGSKSKIGSYPFTTLEAGLGVLGGKIFADIPGLIEGASKGKGLGVKFLKHIEKVTLLLHCISSESENPAKDYEVIREELKKYNPELLKKQEIILLTKSDLLDEKSKKEKMKSWKLRREIIPVSIYDFESIEKLKQVLH